MRDADNIAAMAFGGLWRALRGWQGRHPKELQSKKFVNFVARHFALVSPIHAWLSSI